jgi:hypothetical protein
MQLDALCQFSSAQAVTSTAASSSIYDVTGAGSGNAPNMIGGVTSTGAALIGFDIGAGDGIAIPEVYWNVGTTFTAGGSATMQIQLQAAIDDGTNHAGTYYTIVETDALPVANLTAGTSGQFQVPEISPDMGFGEAMPRFYRLNYVIATGPMTAGKITASLVINPSQATKIQNYPSGYYTA